MRVLTMTMEEFKKEVETGTEEMVYLLIDSFEAFLYSMHHDNTEGRIPNCEGIHTDQEMAGMQQRINYAMDQTPRFGIKRPVRDEKGTPNKSYQKWYRYWDAWRTKMSHERWNKFLKLFPKGEYKAMLPRSKR